MEKLKHIFSPGGDKDDEIMYGAVQDKGESTSSPSTGQESSEPPKLETKPETEEQSHSKMRQIFNPGGEKYSEQSYGTTATTAGETEAERTPGDLETKPEAEDQSQFVGSQISDPSREKYSEQSYGTTATQIPNDKQEPTSTTSGTEQSQPTAQTTSDDSNLGRDSAIAGAGAAGIAGAGTAAYMSRDTEEQQQQPETFESKPVIEEQERTATAPTTTTMTTTTSTKPEPKSEKEEKPSKLKQLFGRSGDKSSEQTSNPVESTSGTEQPVTDDSNFARDAAITAAGTAGVAGASAGAYQYRSGQDEPATTSSTGAQQDDPAALAAARTAAVDNTHSHEAPTGGIASQDTGGIAREDTGDDLAAGTYTARSYYVGGSSDTAPHEPTVEADPNPPPTEGDGSHVVQDTSLAGAGTIIGARDLAESQGPDEHPRDEEVDNATYVDRSAHVGSSSLPTTLQPVAASDVDPSHSATQEAARIDDGTNSRSLAATAPGEESSHPHIPGEFPTETGDDPHVPGESAPHQGGEGFPYESSQQKEAVPAAAPAEESHTGRDAAIAGGAAAATGAAGYGIYEGTKGNDDTSATAAPMEKEEPIVPPTAASTAEPTAERTAIPAAGSVAESTEESHTGRDAAIAGGATAATGAAGYGVYEATRGGDDTTVTEIPEEKTSTMAKMKDTSSSSQLEPETTERNKTEPIEEEDHTGRNTAIAGGAAAATGAAGYGVYEATRDDDKPMEPTRTEPEPQKPAPVQRQPEKKEPVKKETTKSEPAKNESTKKKEPKEEKESTMDKLKKKFSKSEDEKAAEKPVEEEDHTGRNTAIAGGAAAATGAAGYGAYEATRDPEEPTQDTTSAVPAEGTRDTGPAPNTIGPHESDAANVMDPRVRPDPEQQRGESTAAGPYQSDMANKMDPRVTSDPEKAREGEEAKNVEEEEDTHYGRDAAIAGGATAATGAAGYSAYEASKDDTTPTTSQDSPSSSSTHDNRVTTDDQGHHHLHKKSHEEKGEKKPSLISRMLHPNREKERRDAEEKEQREHIQAEIREHQHSHHHVGTDGQIGDPSHVGGGGGVEESQLSSSGREAGTDSSSSGPGYTTLQPGEAPPEGYITLHHEGADPDAPHVVVTDK